MKRKRQLDREIQGDETKKTEESSYREEEQESRCPYSKQRVNLSTLPGIWKDCKQWRSQYTVTRKHMTTMPHKCAWEETLVYSMPSFSRKSPVYIFTELAPVRRPQCAERLYISFKYMEIRTVILGKSKVDNVN